MKDAINEQLSVLLDDELDTDEQALLLRQLARSPELRQRLARYQLISDAMHDNLPAQVDHAFHARVLAALPEAGPERTNVTAARLMRPLAGLALAASVAVVAVVSLQNVREQPPTAVPAVAAVPSPDSYLRAEHGPVPPSPSPGKSGLDVYLVNHNEYAVTRGMQGMLPYVRIVGQELPQSDNNSSTE